MQLGVPATDLRLRLKIAQEGYADITGRVEADLSGRVAGGLYAKVYDELPWSYRLALTEQTTVGGLVDGVRAHAERARSWYDVSVPSVDRVVRDEMARRTRINALPADLRVESTGRTDTPGDATLEQVETARTARAGQPDGQSIDLVADGRKKVALHVEKLASERLLALAKPLTEAVPILARRSQTRPRTLLPLPHLRPLPLLTPYYDMPSFGYGQPPQTFRPPPTYRLPPRAVQPARPVRPPPRIFIW